MEMFERDLDILLAKLENDVDERTKNKLNEIKDRLIHLNEERLVKINHSVMELVCAKPLILKGYEVEVERQLTGNLVCDLYAKRGDGALILEIETGFVPPENALNPITYWKVRIASKIARYSVHSNKFGLGTPPHHILQIPTIFLKPPRDRRIESLGEIKRDCDRYYSNPPLSIDELRYGCLHAVYVIDVDEGSARMFDPVAYSDIYRSI